MTSTNPSTVPRSLPSGALLLHCSLQQYYVCACSLSKHDLRTISRLRTQFDHDSITLDTFWTPQQFDTHHVRRRCGEHLKCSGTAHLASWVFSLSHQFLQMSQLPSMNPSAKGQHISCSRPPRTRASSDDGMTRSSV